MKKVLLFAVVLTGAMTFTSCGSDECVCTTNGSTQTYDEDELGGDLQERCDALDALAKIGSSSDGCSVE